MSEIIKTDGNADDSIVNDIQGAFEILTSIGEVSSLNEKSDILSSGEDNDILKYILHAAYSPFIQYNLKKIPVDIEECSGSGISADRYGEFLQLLVQLHQRSITGNEAIDTVAEFLRSCSEDEYTWYTRIIKKDLRIGMADKGINKVFKGLIPVYDVMLADKVPADGLNLDTPKVLKMLPERMIVQYKIDGYRLNIFVYDDEVEIRTRNGKEVTGYNDLEAEALEKLPAGYVYDGEVVAPELFEWIEQNVKSGESTEPNRDLFSEVMSHAFSKENNKDGVFNMFDMVPIDEWTKRKPTMTLEQRTKLMRDNVPVDELKHIRIVPTSRVYLKSNREDLDEIVNTFHYFISVGWEGLMIKNWDGLYEWKRTKSLIKMKLMDTADLEVIDVFEGDGKYKGKLGGVICDYKGYNLGVGSGWKDDQRDYFWEHKDEIIGKTIEVAYQAETSNKDGGLSLSFPVMKSIRYDK